MQTISVCKNSDKDLPSDLVVNYSNSISDGKVFFLRGVILLLTIIANGIMHFERLTTSSLPIYYDLYFFTSQTNYAIMIWMILFFAWRGNQEKIERLEGRIKGGLTVYITLVSLVYLVLIAPTHNPDGLFIFTNTLHHYVIPPIFVLDTLLTQRQRYQWKWAAQWLIYPLLYLPYALLIAQLTGFYTYFFINIPQLGLSGFFTWVGIMLSLFFIVGLLYVFINNQMTKSND